MGKNITKVNFLKLPIPVFILLLILFLLLVTVFMSSYTFLIQTNDSIYYRGKYLFICGNQALLLKGHQSHKTRFAAINSGETTFSPSLISMKEVKIIEIFPMIQDEDTIDKGPIQGYYLGAYKINASGHAGYLYLIQQKGILYGTLRYPQWGRGANEHLRGLRIYGGQIQFTRSASTKEEVQRLGANSFFSQRYVGKFSASGNEIQGYYYNERGEKNIWQAVR